MDPIECMKKLMTSQIPSPTICSHASEILKTEDESTKVALCNVSAENQCGLVLILSNVKEGYDQVHYFCADQVDQMNNEYNYITCSVAEAKTIYQVIIEKKL